MGAVYSNIVRLTVNDAVARPTITAQSTHPRIIDLPQSEIAQFGIV